MCGAVPCSVCVCAMLWQRVVKLCSFHNFNNKVNFPAKWIMCSFLRQLVCPSPRRTDMRERHRHHGRRRRCESLAFCPPKQVCFCLCMMPAWNVCVCVCNMCIRATRFSTPSILFASSANKLYTECASFGICAVYDDDNDVNDNYDVDDDDADDALWFKLKLNGMKCIYLCHRQHTYIQ